MRSGVALPSWLSEEASLLPMLLLVLLLPLGALCCFRDPRAKRARAVGGAAREACLRAALRVRAGEELGPHMMALRHPRARAAALDEAALASPARLVALASAALAAGAPPRGGDKGGELSAAQRAATRELRARLRLAAADERLEAGGDEAAAAMREALLHAHLRRGADRGGELAACLRAEHEAMLDSCPAIMDALFHAAAALRPLPFRLGLAKVMHFAQAVTQARRASLPLPASAGHRSPARLAPTSPSPLGRPTTGCAARSTLREPRAAAAL